MEARGQLADVFLDTGFCFLRPGLSLSLELTNGLDWLANEFQPSARLHPSTGLSRCCHSAFFIGLRVRCLWFFVLFCFFVLGTLPTDPPCPCLEICVCVMYLCVQFLRICLCVHRGRRLVIRWPLQWLSTSFSETGSSAEAGLHRFHWLSLESLCFPLPALGLQGLHELPCPAKKLLGIQTHSLMFAQ